MLEITNEARRLEGKAAQRLSNPFNDSHAIKCLKRAPGTLDRDRYISWPG